MAIHNILDGYHVDIEEELKDAGLCDCEDLRYELIENKVVLSKP